MRRRQFIVGLWGAFGWASMTLAQGSGKLPIVGFLNSASAEGYGIMATAFKAGLADSGYVEPDNVIVEYRWANDDYTRLPALADQLASCEHGHRNRRGIRNPRSIVCGRLVGRTWPLPGQPAQAARRPCHADPHPRRVRDPRNRRCWRPYELWGECGGGISPSRNIRRPYPQG